MRRLLHILMPVLLAAACCSPAALAASAPVTIVYVSHMADIDDSLSGSGYPALASLMKELRAGKTRVVLFHGGNVLGPSALSSYDKGAHMIGLLNALQPDVLGLGRRDFMHKEDELVLRTDEAVFPILCSNIYDPISLEPPGNSKTGLILKTPVPLGFLALVSPEMQTTYIQRRLVTLGGQELLPSLSADLRGDGARFVAATADFMPENPLEVLAESGLDLLFISSGASETGLRISGGRALATHTGNGDDVLLVRLEPDGESGLAIAGHEVRQLKNYAPDAKMAALTERYARFFANLTQTEVGTTLSELDTRTTVLRSGENAMGNLITDAMRDYYGADVALMNSGGIRGNRVYSAGSTLLRGDLQKEMPLHDMSCFINVRGEVIVAALEHGVSQIELGRGRFLQVSGLTYRYNPAAPPGARVTSVSLGGKPIEADKIYSVSLPEYLSTHGDGFYMFPGECLSKAPRPQQELVEIVRVYLSLHSPVNPRVEGRIQPVRAAE